MNGNVLIAGVGGVLGRELVDAFIRKGIRPAGLSLSEREFSGLDGKLSSRVLADVTRPETLKGVCDGVDILVSVIGITRIRGNLSHMDVDYGGNMNLLAEARRAGVRKFVFISPAGTDLGARQGVPLMEAKFRFEEALKQSGLDWVIVRSGGFMADFAGMAELARKGPLYLIGAGDVVSTPIDVGELAAFMADDALGLSRAYTSIGGPRDMTWREICEACFNVWGRPARTLTVPVWLCRAALALMRPFFFQQYALGKLLVFFSVNSVPTARRGKTDLEAYLQRHYTRPDGCLS
jgi:uncharacterized protein YbjT (DUF2867 family)